jgi:hypothetical protein
LGVLWIRTGSDVATAPCSVTGESLYSTALHSAEGAIVMFREENEALKKLQVKLDELRGYL